MKTRFFASQTSPYNGSGEAAGTYVDALPAHAKAQDTWIPTLPVLTTVERLGIFAPRMLAWDSDLDALVVHDGSSWRLFADGTAADDKITKLDAAISASIGVGLAIIFHALLLLA